MLTNDSIDQFLKSTSDRGGSPETVRAYRRDLLTLHEFAGDTAHGDLDDVAARWLTATRDDVSARTTLRRAATVRSYGKANGIVLLAHYRLPTPSRLKAHPLDGGMVDVLNMLHAANTRRHRAYLALIGLMGLRSSEALAVRPSDVDVKNMTLHVYGKGSKERDLPVSTQAWSWLASAVETAKALGTTVCGDLADRSARVYVERLSERVLGRRVASHDFRMTTGTVMFAKTKNIRAVQEFLGHASSKTTEGYTGVDEATLRAAAEAVGA